MPPQAVVFDFNGTLSDDEPVLCEIFMHLFAEHGRPMSAQEYFARLAGLSDPEGYAQALALLGIEPSGAVVIEDTEAGIASARAAGAGYILAMRTTLEPERLAQADELIDRLDVDVMRRCLS